MRSKKAISCTKKRHYWKDGWVCEHCGKKRSDVEEARKKEESRMTKYKVISLFSGCGGLDLGFQGGFKFLDKKYNKNKFEVIWANDLDSHACQTYEKYFNHPIVC